MSKKERLAKNEILIKNYRLSSKSKSSDQKLKLKYFWSLLYFNGSFLFFTIDLYSYLKFCEMFLVIKSEQFQYWNENRFYPKIPRVIGIKIFERAQFSRFLD